MPRCRINFRFLTRAQSGPFSPTTLLLGTFFTEPSFN